MHMNQMKIYFSVKTTKKGRGLDLMGVRQPQPAGEVAVCDKATFVVETRLVKKASAARRDSLTSHTQVTSERSEQTSSDVWRTS